MKPLSLFLLPFFGMFTPIHAQSYQLTVTNEPFVFLEKGQLAVEEAWDSPEFQIPIGFDFDFFDIINFNSYTRSDLY